MKNRFSIKKCHCCKKKRLLIVMMICDESEMEYVDSPSFPGSSLDYYPEDKEDWESMIDALSSSKIIKGGLLIPRETASLIKPATEDYPKDSIRGVIDVLLNGRAFGTNPRVLDDEILDLFEDIRGESIVEKLIFVRDNSGSLTNSMYAGEFSSALSSLEEDYPNMEIESIDMSTTERWLKAGREAAETF